jgi:hypothetical protein
MVNAIFPVDWRRRNSRARLLCALMLLRIFAYELTDAMRSD